MIVCMASKVHVRDAGFAAQGRLHCGHRGCVCPCDRDRQTDRPIQTDIPRQTDWDRGSESTSCWFPHQYPTTPYPRGGSVRAASAAKRCEYVIYIYNYREAFMNMEQSTTNRGARLQDLAAGEDQVWQGWRLEPLEGSVKQCMFSCLVSMWGPATLASLCVTCTVLTYLFSAECTFESSCEKKLLPAFILFFNIETTKNI